MSLTPKEKNIQRWNEWVDKMALAEVAAEVVAERDANEQGKPKAEVQNVYIDFIYGHQLNRKTVADACGFSKTTLRDNPYIRDKLKKLEDKLRDIKILPTLTDKGKKEEGTPKAVPRESIKQSVERNRVQELEQTVVELKAKIKALEARDGRFGEFAEVAAELSLL